MKTVIRAFFRTLRTVLGPFMLLKERLTQPTGVQREPAAQADVALQCQSLALYQFSTCPFCIKVRQEMRRLSLPIEKRDAQHHSAHRKRQRVCGLFLRVPPHEPPHEEHRRGQCGGYARAARHGPRDGARTQTHDAHPLARTLLQLPARLWRGVSGRMYRWI